MKRWILVLAAIVLLIPARLNAAVTPEAKTVVAKVGEAYSKLKTLELSGKLTGDLEIDGQTDHPQTTFTSSYSAPNRFKSEAADDAAIGSTGEKLYLYEKDHRIYTMADAPKDKVAISELPDPFGQILKLSKTKDPSLALAVAKDPGEELGKSFEQIGKGDDVNIDGKSYTALTFGDEPNKPLVTLLIDPKTNLIRRALLDRADQARKLGASDVKKALVTIDYTTITPDGGGGAAAAATTKPDAFAWAPPPGSRDIDEIAMGGDDETEAAKALLGKPAPPFKLPGLDGKQVALSDLKGSVVVLDFWATWCGPCVMSLPNLDQTYKDKRGDGVKFFAINLMEEKDLVQGFIKSRNLSVPVLLDDEGKIGNKYHAPPIPETVVIGKDGTVRKVFVGVGPQTEREVRDAIDAAMKAPK
jgi:thiol-disulfide isomerase/thioredoxin